MSNQRKFEFSLDKRELHITNMRDEDINGLWNVTQHVAGSPSLSARGFIEELGVTIAAAPGFDREVAKKNTPFVSGVCYMMFDHTVPIASFRPDLAAAKKPVETKAERVKVIEAYGNVYQVWNETKTNSDHLFLAHFRCWHSGIQSWGEPFTSNGGFPKDATILYDSANPLAGVPDGTEWASKQGRFRMVGGKLRYCNWALGSVWIDAISKADHVLELTRYNPDTTVYTPPDWLVALRNEVKPEPAKPVVEEGKFYRPERGLNSALTFRKHNGGIEFWSWDKWVKTDPNFYARGVNLLEVPNPEPKPCYTAADGRKIPVGSWLRWTENGDNYYDLRLTSPQGDSERVFRSGWVEKSYPGHFAASLARPDWYRLELAQ